MSEFRENKTSFVENKFRSKNIGIHTFELNLWQCSQLFSCRVEMMDLYNCMEQKDESVRYKKALFLDA